MSVGTASYTGAFTACATRDRRPSAPITTEACSVTIRPSRVRAADARHPAVLEQQLLDRQLIAEFGARLARGVRQHQIDRLAPRPVGDRHAVGAIRPWASSGKSP